MPGQEREMKGRRGRTPQGIGWPYRAEGGSRGTHIHRHRWALSESTGMGVGAVMWCGGQADLGYLDYGLTLQLPGCQTLLSCGMETLGRAPGQATGVYLGKARPVLTFPSCLAPQTKLIEASTGPEETAIQRSILDLFRALSSSLGSLVVKEESIFRSGSLATSGSYLWIPGILYLWDPSRNPARN